MTTADYCREQAAEMLRRSLEGPAETREHCIELAHSWAALARQSDALAQAVADAAADAGIILDFPPTEPGAGEP